MRDLSRIMNELQTEMERDDIYAYLHALWWEKYSQDPKPLTFQRAISSAYEFLNVLNEANSVIMVIGNYTPQTSSVASFVETHNCQAIVFFKDVDKKLMRKINKGKAVLPSHGYFICPALLSPRPSVIKYRKKGRMDCSKYNPLSKACSIELCDLKLLLKDQKIKSYERIELEYLSKMARDKIENKYSSNVLKKMRENMDELQNFIFRPSRIGEDINYR